MCVYVCEGFSCDFKRIRIMKCLEFWVINLVLIMKCLDFGTISVCVCV